MYDIQERTAMKPMRWCPIGSKIFLLFLLILFLSCNKEDEVGIRAKDVSKEISLIKVYGDGSTYCAFTSLIKRGGQYYIAFREGATHLAENDYGVIRVMTSTDGERWETSQILRKNGVDLRDPNLSIKPDGNLFLICGGRELIEGDKYSTKTYYASENNGEFSQILRVNIPSEIDDKYCCWLWRLEWNGFEGYGVAYRNNGLENKCTLLKTIDGVNFSVVSELEVGELINETRVRFFPDGTMIALMRSANNGYMGVSKPPYIEWEMKKLDIYLAGQDFILTDNGMICSSRLVQPSAEKTAIWYGTQDGIFQWCYILPSSGKNSDTAYSGMLDEGDTLWVSYYSMHETVNPCIYLAKIPEVIFPFYRN